MTLELLTARMLALATNGRIEETEWGCCYITALGFGEEEERALVTMPGEVVELFTGEVAAA